MSILAITTAGLANGLPAAVLASLMVQMSFGFAFTAYDPYSAEPLLFVFSALLTWCWLANRPLTALGLALVGVFVKETVALVSGAAALAAMVNRGREGCAPRLSLGDGHLLRLGSLAECGGTLR